MHRIEKDIIGELEIHKDSLYGIHSLRAKNNFPDHSVFFKEWYKSLGTVKKCIYLTCIDFYEAAKRRYSKLPDSLKIIPQEKIEAMIDAAEQIEQGKYFEHFIVPAINGGAGTSINMNINEIITNLALKKLGKTHGDYDFLHPIDHANVYQSTNDVIPSSLKITLMKLLGELEKTINDHRAATEILENKYRHVLRIGYTQMQEAVPTSFGRLISTYNEALSRDWWRVSKCFERIKTVNLGGSALGTGLAVPRYFLVEPVKKLQQFTGLPIARAENLSDQTSNLDGFVEIHAILKAHAVNLEKITSDLRLLASDLTRPNAVTLTPKQTGSTIMPGKINPVITEFSVSAAHKVYANDLIITSLSAQGCLDLNAYLPIIGHSLIDSIKLLIACNQTIKNNLINGISIDETISVSRMMESPGITTALVPYIGYTGATELAQWMKANNKNIYEANRALNKLPEETLKSILKPENIIKEGFSLKDLLNYETDKGE